MSYPLGQGLWMAWLGQVRAAAARVASAPVQFDLGHLNHPV